MKIVQAVPEDLNDIMILIRKCVKKMNMEGSIQWDKSYPNEKVIQDDIKTQCLYVATSQTKIVGIITLNSCETEEYNQIKWHDTHGKIIVIHRMAVDVQYQKQGIAKKLMTFAEELAKDKGFTSIRTDTYIENVKMQSMFAKLGYTKVGEVFFNNGKPKPFICFEKPLI